MVLNQHNRITFFFLTISFLTRASVHAGPFTGPSDPGLSDPGIIIQDEILQPIGDPQYLVDFKLFLRPHTTLTQGSQLVICDVPGIEPIAPLFSPPLMSAPLDTRFGGSGKTIFYGSIAKTGPVAPAQGSGIVDDLDIYNVYWTFLPSINGSTVTQIVNNTSDYMPLGDFLVLTNQSFTPPPNSPNSPPTELASPLHYGSDVLTVNSSNNVIHNVTYGQATSVILQSTGVPEPSTLLTALVATLAIGLRSKRSLASV